ncbi:hypothetical protein [Leisingera sp. ANG-M7]|uniref:hypothetical protein n=1 Tax=Leisingera sp. ANG-M7 TaxID=1577902 RepID=UPI00057D6151|nr:hypothetical protein [Leisingera sp. ANG-M7]KIC36540.1 hypothetical protein RA26_12455 [Leisingera sp. ANG-M7]
MILKSMTEALATTAVKYAGADKPMPTLEFVMHPNTRKDACLEAGFNTNHLYHIHDVWMFRGIQIREDESLSGWRLSPVEDQF